MSLLKVTWTLEYEPTLKYFESIVNLKPDNSLLRFISGIIPEYSPVNLSEWQMFLILYFEISYSEYLVESATYTVQSGVLLYGQPEKVTVLFVNNLSFGSS